MVTSMSEMLDMMTSMVNMVVTILTAIAAISLSGPKSRMLAGDFCERVRAVTEAARKISANF